MAEEVDTVLVLEKYEDLQKQFETLKTQKETLEKEMLSIKEKEKAEETKKLVEALVKKTGKEAKEFEGRNPDVLRELLEVLPELGVKEKNESKGVVETTKLPVKEAEAEIFEVDKSGDLTATENYWAEWDASIKTMADTTKYKWLQNKINKTEVK